MQDAKSSRATVFALLQWGEALVLGTPPPQNDSLTESTLMVGEGWWRRGAEG